MTSIPRSRSTDRRYYGVVEATVVENVDPEGEGRIKVTFPWFNSEMVTEWCRVAQLYAGNGYGAMFVPELGDEVLVSFIHGDMRLPIIIGGLYNGVDKPPSTHARSDSTDQKFIRTKSGHKIVLNDKDGERKIEIIDASDKNNTIVIDAEANTITIHCDSDLTVQADTGKLTLKGNGVEIQSDADVNITASGDLNAEGTNGTITASGDLNMEGTNGNITASAELKLAGSTIKLN